MDGKQVATMPGVPWGRRLISLLPRGRELDEADWRHRHRAILVLLWIHVVVVPVYGLIQGNSLVHSLTEGLAVLVPAILASVPLFRRRYRAAAATVGLLAASATLVHLSEGLIEMHFHFFVMVPVVAFYQDWFPFLAAIGFVLLHHGVGGAIDPGSVYNHTAALNSPWKWAAVHAFFIAGTSIVCLVNWRLNEDALDRERQAEEDLRDALSILEATLESTADGILVVNNHGEMTNMNQKFIDMWGIPPAIVEARDDEAAIGFVLDQLVDPHAFTAKVEDLYRDPEAESYDELLFKDGRVFERYSCPHRVGGKSVGRVWSFRDVTASKRHEAALRQAMLRDREAVERLEKLDESKNLLLTAVSHELRTPLASVVGFAETLHERDGKLEPAQRRTLLRRLVGGARRLERLLLNLFDLDRISRGILEPRLQATDMDVLLYRVVENAELAGRQVEVQADRVRAMVDPGMIERIVENLLVNAAKHTPPRVPIRLAVENGADGVLITVADEGPGVPDDLKEIIFEPFQQGEIIQTHSPGTGVGLSLVARFAGLHGGEAWVEDVPGGGASFCVQIPTKGTLEASASPTETAARR